MPIPIIVLGAIGNCLDIAEAILANGDNFDLLGFLDDGLPQGQLTPLGVPVLGHLADVHKFPHAKVVNGIGSPANFRHKRAILQRLGLTSERFATVVHPSCVISPSATLGCGSVVLSNCSIGFGARIGDHVLVLQNSVIGHDASVGDESTLAAGVRLSGRVIVEEGCYLGCGACFREGVRVGAHSLIGMGSVVIRDVPLGGVSYGNPARSRCNND